MCQFFLDLDSIFKNIRSGKRKKERKNEDKSTNEHWNTLLCNNLPLSSRRENLRWTWRPSEGLLPSHQQRTDLSPAAAGEALRGSCDTNCLRPGRRLCAVAGGECPLFALLFTTWIQVTKGLRVSIWALQNFEKSVDLQGANKMAITNLKCRKIKQNLDQLWNDLIKQLQVKQQEFPWVFVSVLDVFLYLKSTSLTTCWENYDVLTRERELTNSVKMERNKNVLLGEFLWII